MLVLSDGARYTMSDHTCRIDKAFSDHDIGFLHERVGLLLYPLLLFPVFDGLSGASILDCMHHGAVCFSHLLLFIYIEDCRPDQRSLDSYFKVFKEIIGALDAAVKPPLIGRSSL